MDIVKAEEIEEPKKSVKAEKPKKAEKAKKSKKGVTESVDSIPGNDNIGNDIKTDSIMPPVESDLPADVPADASAMAFVSHTNSGRYMLFHRDYFIREEDED